MSDPGNTLNTATALTLTASAQPSTVSNSVSSSDLLDYFRFTVNRSSNVNVALSGLNGNANLALIRDANNNGTIGASEVIARSTNTGSLSELINSTGLTAGTYFLEVSFSEGAAPVTYTLATALRSAMPATLDWYDAQTGDVHLWTIDGTTIGERNTIRVGANSQIAARGDFNNDGTADLVWRSGNNATVWLMNGTTVADAATFSISADWSVAQVGDLNGDGRSDLIWRSTNGELAYWLMNGQSVANATSLALGTNWQLQAVSDLNGDRKSDLIWREMGSTGQTVVWLMDGMSTIGGGSPATVGLEWSIRQVGDLDGDRKSDLVWTHTTSGDVSLWLMDGGAVRTAQVRTQGAGWQLTHSGDLDADGKLDLIWRRPSNGDISIWLMDGLTRRSFREYQPGSAWQLQSVADVNGDSRADLVWRATGVNQAAIWTMNGTTVAQAEVLTNVTVGWSGGVRRGRLDGAIPIDEAGSTISNEFNVGSLQKSEAIYSGWIGQNDLDDIYRFTLISETLIKAELTRLTGDADVYCSILLVKQFRLP